VRRERSTSTAEIAPGLGSSPFNHGSTDEGYCLTDLHFSTVSECIVTDQMTKEDRHRVEVTAAVAKRGNATFVLGSKRNGKGTNPSRFDVTSNCAPENTGPALPHRGGCVLRAVLQKQLRPEALNQR
jgi:hypothetical protein